MIQAPSFVPLKQITAANLLDCTTKGSSNPALMMSPAERVLQITYEELDIHQHSNDPEASFKKPGQMKEVMLTSEMPNQVIEWTEMIRRLQRLYEESKGAIEAVVGKQNRGFSLFDNKETQNVSMISPIDTVRKVITPGRQCKTPMTGV